MEIEILDGNRMMRCTIMFQKKKTFGTNTNYQFNKCLTSRASKDTN